MHGQGGKQKQRKKIVKWASRGCFTIYGRGEKKQKDDRDDHGDQRGPKGAIEGEQGVRDPIEMQLGNAKARKQAGRQNKSAKQGRSNMSTKTTNCREKRVTRK